MAKLPDNFVKSPPASGRLTTAKPAAAKLGRRSRKDLDSEAQSHVESVLVRLSADEHEALSAACTALVAVGQTVSIEDMIKQVVARWIAATRAMQAPSVPAPMAPMTPAPAIASIRAQLRKLAAEPVRRWHELGRTLRRWSHVLEHR
jgi:hypothetical protein